MARPKKPIDLTLVENLSRIGCTQDEIASIVGCTARTLRSRAAEAMARGQDEMRASIRRWQYEKAKGGSVPMLIWLGKQYLGQRDRQDTLLTEAVVEIERIAPTLTEATD
jgi:predicted transcriptional regulator